MKRFGAVVVATALIVAALWYRGVFDGGDAGGGATDHGDEPARPDGSPAMVICATELGAVCSAALGQDDRVTLTVEAPGATAERLAGTEGPDWDLWVVSEPWPAIAAVRARIAQRELRLSAGKPFATQPLRLVMTTQFAGLLDCASPDLTGCAMTGSRAGIPPAATTGGLLGAATIASSVLGRADFATNDLDDGVVEDALAGIADSTDQVADPVTRLITAPGSFDAAIDLGAVVPPNRAARATAADVKPPVRARAVVVARGRSTPSTRWSERLADALDDTGWQRVSGPAPDSGLRANPGTLDAVARLWEQATR